MLKRAQACFGSQMSLHPLIQYVCVQRHTPAGTFVVRPMSMEQVFEASLVITEAFLVDPDPPEFSWTRFAQQMCSDPALLIAWRARLPLVQASSREQMVKLSVGPASSLLHALTACCAAQG